MQSLQDQIANGFTRLAEAFLSVIPAVLVLAVSLVVGVAVGTILSLLFRLLARLGRAGVAHPDSLPSRFLRAAGVRADMERVAGAVSFWVGVVVILSVGVNALEPGSLKSVLKGIVDFLPRLFAAGLLFLLGLGVAMLARRSFLLGAVNAGLPWARSGARVLYAVVLTFFVAAAIEHLGVGSSILVAGFSIVAGGLVFALALAFGLGARDLARRYLEKKLRAEAEDSGIRHV